MNAVRIVLALLVAMAIPAQLLADDAKAKPMEKLETAIPEGIRLLEAKDYQAFLKSFVPPDLLKKITEEVCSLDKFAEKFGSDKADGLMKVLKSIKDAKPKLENDGKEETYEIDEKLQEHASGKKDITFVKIGDSWYIQN